MPQVSVPPVLTAIQLVAVPICSGVVCSAGSGFCWKQ
jgi:hypothetical protein